MCRDGKPWLQPGWRRDVDRRSTAARRYGGNLITSDCNVALRVRPSNLWTGPRNRPAPEPGSSGGGNRFGFRGFGNCNAGEHQPTLDAAVEEAPLTTYDLLRENSHPAAGGRKPEDSMKNLAKKMQRFLTSEDGPTAVEYAVMLALIIIVCLTAIQSVGTKANTTFTNVAASIGAS